MVCREAVNECNSDITTVDSQRLAQAENTNPADGSHVNPSIGDCGCDELVASPKMIAAIGCLIAVEQLTPEIRRIIGV
jgi:hypothetical protein